VINKNGGILIYTLWVLAILAVISVMLSYRASTDMKLAKYESDKIKGLYLARAGVMKMLIEITGDANAYDSMNEKWNKNRNSPGVLTIGKDKVFYGCSDEKARLNLNAQGLAAEHLMGLGAGRTAAESILNYRSEKGDKGFEFMEELFLAGGVTGDIYSSLKDSVTIYTGKDARVNINTADKKVLKAILKDDALVREILARREGLDGKEGTEDDGIFKNTSDLSMVGGIDPSLFSVSTNVFRIWAESSLSKSVEAVIDRNGKIYHWKEYDIE
jgi:type II secretory pathway component PulK